MRLKTYWREVRSFRDAASIENLYLGADSISSLDLPFSYAETAARRRSQFGLKGEQESRLLPLYAKKRHQFTEGCSGRFTAYLPAKRRRRIRVLMMHVIEDGPTEQLL